MAMAAVKVAALLGVLLRATTNHEVATAASRAAAKVAMAGRSRAAASNIKRPDDASLAACEVFPDIRIAKGW
jgi:hypothetical protein